MTQSPTTRSKAHYGRAARVLAPVALDAEVAVDLAVVRAARGGKVTTLIRALIREEASRIRESDPADSLGPSSSSPPA